MNRCKKCKYFVYMLTRTARCRKTDEILEVDVRAALCCRIEYDRTKECIEHDYWRAKKG